MDKTSEQTNIDGAETGFDTALLEVETDPKGKFFESLNRNNKTIKRDRAIAIAEEAQTAYKRYVEDLETSIKRLVRERAQMLDLSPSDANSLILAKEFDAAAFVKRDLKIGLDIRNLQIQLDIARRQYDSLFE